MEVIVPFATAVIGAYSSYESGQIKKQEYGLKAKQATVEGQRKAIQYEQRSNDVLRRRLEANAALIASGYAGGIDPFSGSPDIVRAANETKAGREYAMLLADADAAMRGGAIQAQLYESAGRAAARKGTFDAIVKLGIAAGFADSYLKETQAPAEITTAQGYPTNQFTYGGQ
jgi:hypothetical protein